MNLFARSTEPDKLTCDTSTLARFTKQMAVLLGAGMPLHEALDTLSEHSIDNITTYVAPKLFRKVTHGHKLSHGMAGYPRVFPTTYIALVRVAEETGGLQQVMESLSEWLETQDKIQRYVKKALTYPAFVVVLVTVMTLVLFQTVIPEILKTVVELGADLPLPTKLLMAIVAVVKQPIFWILAILAIIGSVFYIRTPQGTRNLTLFFQVIPVTGPILAYGGGCRYANTLAMLLESGVDIIRSCIIAAEASGNPLIKADSQRVVRDLREGRALSESLEFSPHYPPLLVDMAKVGDETGEMATILHQSKGLLEEETMHRLDLFINLLEPVVLAGVSIMVGCVLVAILLPMANLISAL